MPGNEVESPRVDRRLIFLRTLADEQTTWILLRTHLPLGRNTVDFAEGRRFFRPGGARPQTQVRVDFIDQHRDQHGVEPICIGNAILSNRVKRGRMTQIKPLPTNTGRFMVPRRGLEPPPTCVDQHLKLARLPIPPPGLRLAGTMPQLRADGL